MSGRKQYAVQTDTLFAVLYHLAVSNEIHKILVSGHGVSEIASD